jgi:DNA gyrase inhibitor GyrI
MKRRKASVFAYIEYDGPFTEIPFNEIIEKLYSWAEKNELKHDYRPIGIYHDIPKEPMPKNCKIEIGIEITEGAQTQGEIKIRPLPEMEVASLKHTGKPAEFHTTYRIMDDWIVKNGYKWMGPPITVYNKIPFLTFRGETMLYGKILAPIMKDK